MDQSIIPDIVNMEEVTVEMNSYKISIKVPLELSTKLSNYVKRNKSVNNGKALYVNMAAKRIFELKMSMLGYKESDYKLRTVSCDTLFNSQLIINPEADEISNEDLKAASDKFDEIVNED